MPAVALTALARSEDRTRALRAGFQLHVAKPVDFTELSRSCRIWPRFGPDRSLNQPRNSDRAVGDSLNTSGALSRKRVSAAETLLRHRSDRERAAR